jgi:hypothetical protein
LTAGISVMAIVSAGLPSGKPLLGFFITAALLNGTEVWLLFSAIVWPIEPQSQRVIL